MRPEKGSTSPSHGAACWPRHSTKQCKVQLLVPARQRWAPQNSLLRLARDQAASLQQDACQSLRPGELTETRNVSFFCLLCAVHMVMASAAAVASSSKEQLDSGIPVKSATIVWKFSSDSSLHRAALPRQCGSDLLSAALYDQHQAP